jgi:hypothetical protein
MAHVLAMAAREMRHPVAIGIAAEPDDRLLHRKKRSAAVPGSMS